MTVSLRLFGGVSLEHDGHVLVGPAAQRHRLALLALLAVSPSRALSRDKLMALLWPERDAEHARKLLNQSVYVLRRDLGTKVVRSAGEEIRLGVDELDCDVIAFEGALAAGDLAGAVALYEGPFLDGFHLVAGPALEHWISKERARLSEAYADALETLAEAAEREGAARDAVRWWRLRAALDPYNSRVAVRLVEAMAAEGNPAGALRHAAAHERLLSEDLGMGPPDRLSTLVEELRHGGTEWLERSRGGSEERDVEEPGERPVGASTVVGSAPLPRRAAGGDADPPTVRQSPMMRFGGVVLVAGLVILTVLRSRDPPVAPLPVTTACSIPATELYERGMDRSLLRSADGALRALRHFEAAIARDSVCAPAWVGLAQLSMRLTTSDLGSPSREALRTRAEEAARQAVRLDSTLASAHATLGLVLLGDFDFSGAREHLQRAIRLDPTGARPHQWLVTLELWTGRSAEALTQARRAVALEPSEASTNAELARALAANGRCDEALALIEEKKLDALDPPLLRTGLITARCHLGDGRWEEAIAELGRQWHLEGAAYSRGLLAYALARTGRRQEALDIRAELLGRWRRGDGDSFALAIADAGLGDLDGAFIWLERAIDEDSLTGWPPHLQTMGIVFSTLEGDPRFEGLRRRLGLGTPESWG